MTCFYDTSFFAKAVGSQSNRICMCFSSKKSFPTNLKQFGTPGFSHSIGTCGPDVGRPQWVGDDVGFPTKNRLEQHHENRGVVQPIQVMGDGPSLK